MPFLDIEKAIKRENIGSRFRLVNIASQRARELNSDRDDVMGLQIKKYDKVTTNALAEVITEKVEFIPTQEDE